MSLSLFCTLRQVPGRLALSSRWRRLLQTLQSEQQLVHFINERSLRRAGNTVLIHDSSRFFDRLLSMSFASFGRRAKTKRRRDYDSPLVPDS